MTGGHRGQHTPKNRVPPDRPRNVNLTWDSEQIIDSNPDSTIVTHLPETTSDSEKKLPISRITGGPIVIRLSDGAQFQVKVDVVEARRKTDKRDEFGAPIYLFTA